MNIGWVGLGKLGLPCAAVLASRGHSVTGFDINLDLARLFFDAGDWPHFEDGFRELAVGGKLTITDDLVEVVRASEVIFVAVQTPHHPDYEGVTPTPREPRDFDYTFLERAVLDIVATAESEQQQITVVVVSTVLPGTCERILFRSKFVRYAYSPAFIAMGTTVPDFLDPEFTLIGTDDNEVFDQVASIFAKVHDAPIIRTSIPSAELAKVAYNTYIGFKIVFANTLAEICAGTGADVDQVTGVLTQADRRLMSRAYLTAGMGDGGGCHPRDQIAMSWLAQELGLSVDLFDFVARARDIQTWSLAVKVAMTASDLGLPVIVLGEAYKANTSITVGSPARLLVHYLNELGVYPTVIDPIVGHDWPDIMPQAVYVVATRHDLFRRVRFPSGSTVIDPWRYIKDQDGVTVMRMGEGS